MFCFGMLALLQECDKNQTQNGERSQAHKSSALLTPWLLFLPLSQRWLSLIQEAQIAL